MILANTQISEYIYKHRKDIAILRKHPKPNQESLSILVNKLKENFIINSETKIELEDIKSIQVRLNI